ncbi:MAG: SufD family Fe-S cluster assembly protein [Acutalibacteraceae bacterium]|nr:SufD family Fe-S cluster assembly protein [Clostridia bacterium]MEE3450048.1 SufD family Fe-S cluster assembly protein [Acutalibacteraceae bacterium]
MDEIQMKMLHEVAELDSLPVGAYNIRANGASAARNSTANIEIVTKTDKSGIDIIIKPNTKNESVHIPVVISETGLKESVYNDFFIGDNCDVVIIAGCGIHNCGNGDSAHDGIHTFYVGKNSKVKYVEKHYGEGEGRGKKLMNPTTVVNLDSGAQMFMQTAQIAGIDDTLRKTTAILADNAKLEINESVMTTGTQNAISEFTADLNGENCKCNIVSRTVAKNNSKQHFTSRLNGNNACSGHTECDSIIMDSASVLATPELLANSTEASLIHEAAIGKIAGEQIIKLMTLGLTEAEAEEQIISGFLK